MKEDAVKKILRQNQRKCSINASHRTNKIPIRNLLLLYPDRGPVFLFKVSHTKELQHFRERKNNEMKTQILVVWTKQASCWLKACLAIKLWKPVDTLWQKVFEL